MVEHRDEMAIARFLGRGSEPDPHL